MRVAIVKVEPTCKESELNLNDLEVAGEYEVSLNTEVTEVQIADVALDIFHSNIAVKTLDDFLFTVFFRGKKWCQIQTTNRTPFSTLEEFRC